MVNRILFVDDEPNVLQAFDRQLRKRFDMVTAIGPDAALRLVSEDTAFAVVVSDLRMPGMDGIEFLARVRTLLPDATRIMLTGQADLSHAILAVNRGHIFQFLTKPCPAGASGGPFPSNAQSLYAVWYTPSTPGSAQHRQSPGVLRQCFPAHDRFRFGTVRHSMAD
jgi:CheY-like chemotaxis protein